jgi:ABC-2 type transport system ATP-binding protein
MSDLTIEVRSLVKRYGKVAALDGLTLSVRPGTVYGFLGRNGAGKTTTIRILAGLARPTEGGVSVLGLNPQRDRLAVLSRTGFLIEQVLLSPMTGNDLIRFNRAFFPTWSDAVAKRYAEALEIPLTCAFRKLSHGNRTKLCLLLALAQGAELLVLDEPTTGLDPVITDQLLSLLIEDFSGSGRTLLLSSHDLSEIEKVCDWIGIIDQGRMLLEAQLDDVRTNYGRVRAAGERLPLRGAAILAVSTSQGISEYVVRSGPEDFAAHLRSQGATVLDASPMNLSEIFIALVGKETHDRVEMLA